MAYSGDLTLTRSDTEVDLTNLIVSIREGPRTNLELDSVEGNLEPRGPEIIINSFRALKPPMNSITAFDIFKITSFRY